MCCGWDGGSTRADKCFDMRMLIYGLWHSWKCKVLRCHDQWTAGLIWVLTTAVCRQAKRWTAKEEPGTGSNELREKNCFIIFKWRAERRCYKECAKAIVKPKVGSVLGESHLGTRNPKVHHQTNESPPPDPVMGHRSRLRVSSHLRLWNSSLKKTNILCLGVRGNPDHILRLLLSRHCVFETAPIGTT